ncbi:hypothetical protein P5P86_14345 [Nocardioides sp. BP30]|uniref:hypothetical protein n=1 Tax=Nocardioides sp. BP30 TaxID=3036374 RepID=UPI00246948FF|nr:hypothetical protein [Nocardioides sp. BP30]WGL51138.1 hypothetical protein P5P86_14345 [Nocardioides sp. BP30]
MAATRSVSVAETARSILSCPAGIDLVVERVDDPTADDPRLALSDADGVPTLSCRVGATLSRAAVQGRGCVLTLASGLGPERSRERAASLALAGRLRRTGAERCNCCGEVRDVVVVDVDAVRLTFDGERVTVPTAAFAAPDLELNRGLLQRWCEHATGAHQEELRQAVAGRRGRHLAEIVAVSLASLSAADAELDWVEADGGHRMTLAFPQPARSSAELGALLRQQLHPRLC